MPVVSGERKRLFFKDGIQKLVKTWQSCVLKFEKISGKVIMQNYTGQFISPSGNS